MLPLTTSMNEVSKYDGSTGALFDCTCGGIQARTPWIRPHLSTCFDFSSLLMLSVFDPWLSFGDVCGAELANTLWSLGKMNFDFGDSQDGHELKNKLIAKLGKLSHKLNVFDLESIFVGLGLMQIPYVDLTVECQNGIILPFPVFSDCVLACGVSMWKWTA
jgi:hypothetical protein